MDRTEKVAKLLDRLTKLAPENIKESQKISNELMNLAGHWSEIQVDSSYIKAIQLDEDGTLLKKAIAAYIQLRRDFVSKINRPEFDLSINNRSFILMNLVQNVGEYGYLAIADIKRMILDDDVEIHWTGCKALKSIGYKATEAIPEIFNAMAKRGVNEYPFTLGEVLVQIVDKFPDVLILLKDRLQSNSEKLIQGVLYTFFLLGNRAEIAYEDLFKIALEASNESKNLAIIALSAIGKKDDKLLQLLLESAISSEYYLRGNAISSMGYLKMSPGQCLPIIINALDDVEGYDWTVREKAIEALAEYKKDAEIAIPKLKALRKSIRNSGEDISLIRKINVVIGKIQGTISF